MSEYTPKLNRYPTNDQKTLEWMAALRGRVTPAEIKRDPVAALEALEEMGISKEQFLQMPERQKSKVVGKLRKHLVKRHRAVSEQLEALARQEDENVDALTEIDRKLYPLGRKPIFGRDESVRPSLRDRLRAEASGEKYERDILMPVTSSMMRNAQHGPAYPGATDIMTEVTMDVGGGSEYTRHATEDLKEVAYRFMGGMVLEKPQGMSFHHFIDYMEEVWPSTNPIKEEQDFWGLIRDQRSFVVEHNWHAAFATRGEGFAAGGEIRTPYACTCFEFRISGVRVLVLTSTSSSDNIWTWLALGINRRWYLDPKSRVLEEDRLVLKQTNQSLQNMVRGTGYDMNEVGERLAEFVARQIRACCIVLDSGLAVAQEQPPSPKHNARRQAAGRSVLKPYHVVSLAPKYRERREHQGGTHASPRFHWRRGHYKHYKEAGSGQEQYVSEDGYLRSRTWVNWMPVNLHMLEELGFVDKHYKL